MFFNFIVLTILYVFTILGKYFHLEIEGKVEKTSQGTFKYSIISNR